MSDFCSSKPYSNRYTVTEAATSPSFDDHEQVSFIEDTHSGLRAFIAIHNTRLGAAVGGCRLFPYASKEEALEDVLRLSRGMTYKSALAGLPMGGGKAVIMGDPRKVKSPELWQAMAEFINEHQGRYVTAEDSGTCVEDMRLMASKSEHVLGLEEGGAFGGDPSPLTAKGVLIAMQAAARHRFKSEHLSGLHVAIQGIGSVGFSLCEQLLEAGAKVSVADTNAARLRQAQALGAQELEISEIHRAQADIFAPCAMGAVLNDVTIPELAAPVIVGAANNQLASAYHARVLKTRGVTYAPDFVVNSGGIIDVYRQFKNASVDECYTRINAIDALLTDVLDISEQQNLDTARVAEAIAEQRFKDPDPSNRAQPQGSDHNSGNTAASIAA